MSIVVLGRLPCVLGDGAYKLSCRLWSSGSCHTFWGMDHVSYCVYCGRRLPHDLGDGSCNLPHAVCSLSHTHTPMKVFDGRPRHSHRPNRDCEWPWRREGAGRRRLMRRSFHPSSLSSRFHRVLGEDGFHGGLRKAAGFKGGPGTRHPSPQPSSLRNTQTAEG